MRWGLLIIAMLAASLWVRSWFALDQLRLGRVQVQSGDGCIVIAFANGSQFAFYSFPIQHGHLNLHAPGWDGALVIPEYLVIVPAMIGAWCFRRRRQQIGFFIFPARTSDNP